MAKKLPKKQEKLRISKSSPPVQPRGKAMTDRYANMINDGCPERIWIESEGGCPYFYHEDELSDVGSPVTEYVRADKLRAEIERLRAEDEGRAITAVQVTLFGRACWLPADIAEAVEQACAAHEQEEPK